MSQPLPLDKALEAVRRDPTRSVFARVDGLTVELRAVPEPGRVPRFGAATGLLHVHDDFDEPLEDFAPYSA